MLSEVLSKSTCAECRFCCSFRRCSLWETPLFLPEVVENYEGEDRRFCIEEKDGYAFGRMELTHKYQTACEQEEAACSFLDPQKGCVLSDEEKPFDCKIWPLRIMNKDGKLFIALTPTCPSINKYPIEKMEALVRGGLDKKIFDYAKEHPFIVKEYKEGFPILSPPLEEI